MVSKLSVKWAILLVMGVAFTAEIAQLLQMHKLLNIKQELTLVLMGTSFSFIDLIAYTSGIIPIYFIEKLRNYETD
jgi:nicotinamide riboside transporter PnuC